MRCKHEWIGEGKEKHCSKCGLYPNLLVDFFYIESKKPTKQELRELASVYKKMGRLE